jgi:hypothetical protein
MIKQMIYCFLEVAALAALLSFVAIICMFFDR